MAITEHFGESDRVITAVTCDWCRERRECHARSRDELESQFMVRHYGAVAQWGRVNPPWAFPWGSAPPGRIDLCPHCYAKAKRVLRALCDLEDARAC